MRPSLDAGNKAPSKVATEKRNIRRLEAIRTCDLYLRSCVLHLDRTDVKLKAIDNQPFDPIGRSWAINLKPNDCLCGCRSGFLSVMSCSNFWHGASFRRK